MKKPILSLLFLLLSLAATAQTGGNAPPAPASQVEAKKPAPEHQITAAETKELFASVDEILKFASERTLLPVKQPVKKAMVGRADVEKYISDKFKDDADRIRFERSELVLKKFGLLPRRFNLHDFLIKLLGEQVAGYYDEKTKTMNLLNWVEFEMQKPVMAHELTHALQDQSFDLDKMMRQDEEIEKRGPEDANALISIDEASTARSAVMEGQAMVVLMDYILAPAGHTVEDSPKMVDMMEAQMEKSGDSPLLDNAPLLLREELVFPYGAGMKFVARLLASGGTKLAFRGVLERMPTTSREILQPEEYLAGHHIAPLLLPNFDFLKRDFEPFDAGAVGQLDVQILLKQYTEEAVANRLSPEWRGGSYYAVGRRGVKPQDPNSSSHVALIYVSRWSNEKVAKEFAKIYAAALPGRYNKLQQAESPATHPGREKYLSADGPVFIEQTGDLVIAVESFDDATADKIIKAVLQKMGAQAEMEPVVPDALFAG